MHTDCPKKMIFGPCGGVRADLACEMGAFRCAFVGDEAAAVSWTGPPAQRPPVAAPLVLTDLSVPPADAVTLAATARVLAPTCDALLVGDHQDRRDFPPVLLARMIADAGATPWVTLACRDRNRAVLETELAGLRHDGLATVLCVTGDGRAYDVRPDITQVFDLDGTRLAALASAMGVTVAVAETPTAPPTGLRAQRLAAKQRAGAQLAVLNHVRTPSSVGHFVTTARAAGLTIPVLGSVAVFTDDRSAAVLAALPGLEIEPTVVRGVLSAADPVAAGIDAAVAEAEALLAAGAAGVNLSGLASARGTAFAASVQAEIGARIKDGSR